MRIAPYTGPVLRCQNSNSLATAAVEGHAVNKGLPIAHDYVMKFTLLPEDILEDPELVDACKNHKMLALMKRLATQKDRTALRFGPWSKDNNIDHQTVTYYMGVRVDRVQMTYSDSLNVPDPPKTA